MSKIALNKDYQTLQNVQALVESNVHYSGLIALMSVSKLSIVKTILDYALSYQSIFPSQATIARRAGGLSRGHTNRLLKQLHEHGFILKVRPEGRPFDSCEYIPTEVTVYQRKRIFSLLRMLRNVTHWVGLSLSLAISPSSAVKDTHVTPYSYKDIYLYPPIAISPNKPTVKCVERVNEATNTRARARESTMQPDWITPELQQATLLLRLSKWGQIYVAVFPAQAIAYANNAYKNSRAPKSDPFKWYMSVCGKWCRDNNTEPNLASMRRRATEYSMPDKPCMVLITKTGDGDVNIPFSGTNNTRMGSSRNSIQERLVSVERQKCREKQAAWEAQFTPEELAHKQRVVLASNPEWMQLGKDLGVDMTRYEVTEEPAVVVCRDIDKEDKVWDKLEPVPFEGDDSQWQEIF